MATLPTKVLANRAEIEVVTHKVLLIPFGILTQGCITKLHL